MFYMYDCILTKAATVTTIAYGYQGANQYPGASNQPYPPNQGYQQQYAQNPAYPPSSAVPPPYNYQAGAGPQNPPDNTKTFG